MTQQTPEHGSRRERRPFDVSDVGKIIEAADRFGQEVEAARREAAIGELSLAQEASAFMSSMLPAVVDSFKPKNIGAGVAEYAPLPFAPWWAVGDVIGVMRAVRSSNAGKPMEALLKFTTAVIPLVPTAPTHAFINRWMDKRTTMANAKPLPGESREIQ